MLSTRTVASLTAHNVAGSPTYNKAGIPANFTGLTCKGTPATPVFTAIDSTLEDDSQNPAAPMTINKGPWGDSFHSLMPNGWAGRVMCCGVLWWQSTGHDGISIGVNQHANPGMTNLLQDMKDRGIDCVDVDWYEVASAPGDGAPDNALVDLLAASLPAGLNFCVDINQHYLTSGFYTWNGAGNHTQGMIDAINLILTRWAGNAKYERYSGPLVAYKGRPIIPLWDIASVFSGDWNAVRAGVQGHVNGNPLIIGYQRGGFSQVQSDGGWAWIDTFATSVSDPSGVTNYLANDFLPACAANSSKICISAAWPGFNGTLTKVVGWSLGKFVDRQNGKTWQAWWAANANFVNSGQRLDYVMADTWDDYEEGSSLQGGIRTDVAITASLAASVISFAVTGTEATVKQYNLWGSSDGINATLLLSTVPGQTKQFNLGNLPALNGTFTLYVEAMSFAGLQTHVAAQNFSVVFGNSTSGGGTTTGVPTGTVPGVGVITAPGSTGGVPTNPVAIAPTVFRAKSIGPLPRDPVINPDTGQFADPWRRKIQEITANANASVAGSGQSDTHANRVAKFLASSFPIGATFYESDRGWLYEDTGTAWRWVGGVFNTPFANLPGDLGASDSGALFYASDQTTLYLWDGAAWHIPLTIPQIIDGGGF